MKLYMKYGPQIRIVAIVLPNPTEDCWEITIDFDVGGGLLSFVYTAVASDVFQVKVTNGQLRNRTFQPCGVLVTWLQHGLSFLPHHEGHRLGELTAESDRFALHCLGVGKSFFEEYRKS